MRGYDGDKNSNEHPFVHSSLLMILISVSIYVCMPLVPDALAFAVALCMKTYTSEHLALTAIDFATSGKESHCSFVTE